ncbi:beta-ketoacyl-[acyl-carrier-protein] synthase family protein [Fertoebacter nigrum]|uniref:Beta-ketoacyl-[acyl-carrier-protein] synthase family protein n=1 Tax=Fertoeibacter niger TaxID=2656921 RepID=A0A8X8GW29_9RHOB|nr:beta-ketoacyl-[acyl-carrier-protein] synthase family protein [Fertoeibacter niger]NUB45444.1 beta-ketoacyl-[acyl-carrier-protein] synthase family protein [Fertoeibacter niger]
MTRSVVVTGLGVVARDVIGTADFGRVLSRGGTAPEPPPQFDSERFRARLAHVADPLATRAALHNADCGGLMAAVTEAEVACAGHGILAALQAIRQAGLDAATLHRAGCAVATTSGGMMDRYSDALDAGTSGSETHDLVVPCSAALVLQRVFGLTGPLCGFSCACVSSLAALSYALARVRNGDVPLMLVGGSDRMREADFAGFNALRAMDRDSCRPFDRTRKGMVIGDGAAMLVIEDEDHARARGATPLVRLAGMGLSTDSYHITSPNSRGLAMAMRQALAEAGRSPSDIGYVNCHGTGTPLNDIAEAEALASVFTGDAPRPIVGSTKGSTGHLLGSAGAIETVATILALQAGEAPLMATTTDPEDIGFALPLAGTDRRLATGLAMNNSLGFGGLNGSLILELVTTGEP